MEALTSLTSSITATPYILTYLGVGSDADWAGDTDTRRSHTGFVIMLNGGPISWKSSRQDSVALFSSEAEYIGPCLCGQEIVYIRAILRDFGVSQSQPTLVYEDNFACIAMSINSVRRKYSRHIDVPRYSRTMLEPCSQVDSLTQASYGG